MREAVAIVASAIDINSITKRVDAAHIELQDAERAAKDDEARSVRSSELAARKRLVLGRELCEARKAWPARGPNAKGWGDWLTKRGIEQQRAWEYMRIAGYVEVSPTFQNDGERPAPTLAAAGIDKRPRKSEQRAEEQPDPEPAAHPPAVEIDIDRELTRIRNKLCSFAESVSPKARKQIAHELREAARLIEEMK